MNNYVWLFIGFMFGFMFEIIISIIIKIVCTCKIFKRNQNRGTLIIPRRYLQTFHIIPQNITSISSDDYSISIDETDEDSKEENQNIDIRISENA